MKRIVWTDETCNSCEKRLNSWDIRLSKALGYKYPICEECIAKEYDVTIDELRSIAEHHFGMTPCLGI